MIASEKTWRSRAALIDFVPEYRPSACQVMDISRCMHATFDRMIYSMRLVRKSKCSKPMTCRCFQHYFFYRFKVGLLSFIKAMKDRVIPHWNGWPPSHAHTIRFHSLAGINQRLSIEQRNSINSCQCRYQQQGRQQKLTHPSIHHQRCLKIIRYAKSYQHIYSEQPSLEWIRSSHSINA